MSRIDWDPLGASAHEPSTSVESPAGEEEVPREAGAPSARPPTGSRENRDSKLALDFDLEDGIVKAFSASPKIEEMIRKAMAGALPWPREKRDYETEKLNAKHLSVIMLKALGHRNVRIAEITGYTEAWISTTVNHPYARRILSAILTEASLNTADIQERLKDAAPAMLDVVEDVAFDPDAKPSVRARNAFKWLELAGYGAKQRHEHKVEGHITMESDQAELLKSALEESRQIQEAEYVVLGDEAREDRRLGPGGGDGSAPDDPASGSGSLPPGASGTSPSDELRKGTDSHGEDGTRTDFSGDSEDGSPSTESAPPGGSSPSPRISTSDGEDEEAA